MAYALVPRDPWVPAAATRRAGAAAHRAPGEAATCACTSPCVLALRRCLQVSPLPAVESKARWQPLLTLLAPQLIYAALGTIVVTAAGSALLHGDVPDRTNRGRAPVISRLM